jgi:hypothetical protein
MLEKTAKQAALCTAWTADFETPACWRAFFRQKKTKNKFAHWHFKVCSPYSSTCLYFLTLPHMFVLGDGVGHNHSFKTGVVDSENKKNNFKIKPNKGNV